ncbi:MAG: A/G-specific adenine glycosylase [Blastopirellula sp.]|nr:MAG: A/G-specific adenine glycosylase [Blastopirellula sp.]
MPEARWLTKFRSQILRWYKTHARDLPWRASRDPYRIWVSEIMLQQTQVATVHDYFLRFLQEFPTVADLAAAKEDRVLRLWEGLGYYRRSRQMHKAAQLIVENYSGVFPQDFQLVNELPGIGRYTAGAITSIAFDDKQPILEANTIRVHARLLAYPDEPTKAAGQRLLWHFAELVLPKKESGRFNQALMELGSQVCTPTNPKCSECPVMGLCPTFAGQLQAEIPKKKKRMKFEDRNEVAVVIQKKNKFLVRKCRPDERWAGLWDFPRFDLTGIANGERLSEIENKANQQTGTTIQLGDKITTIKHGVTKYRITLDVYRVQSVAGRLKKTDAGELCWVNAQQLEALPLSTTGRKIERLLAQP